MSNEAPPSNDSKHSALLVAYECLFDHLNMHDQHIYRMLAFFGAVIAGFLAAIETFIHARTASTVLLALVALSFSAVLGRIAFLVTKLRNRIHELGCKLGMQSEASACCHTCPDSILPNTYGKPNSWFRTAYIAILIVVVVSTATVILLWNLPSKVS